MYFPKRLKNVSLTKKNHSPNNTHILIFAALPRTTHTDVSIDICALIKHYILYIYDTVFGRIVTR